MADILVRGLDDEVATILKQQARSRRQSVNDLVKGVIETSVRSSQERLALERAELFKDIDEMRERIGRMPDDAVDLIREDRDSR